MLDHQMLFQVLLDRNTVPPDEKLLSLATTGKTVMVTGAGGSIGAELCRQLAEWQPETIILFECSEFSLYATENALRVQKGASLNGKCINIVPVLGSVLDTALLESILSGYRVDTLYHAAAYKHVPMLERNVIAGVRNNVFGTWTLAQAALKHRVGQFILISTDKAVRPVSIMGATKRFAEQLLQALNARQGATRFSTIRFGNVLGSSGSVLPLFQEQILGGGPVTVTHPDMSRYFMTAGEASQFVIQASALAQGGEVFALDMRNPVRIADMARKLINLMGFEVCACSSADACGCTRGINIRFTGLRPGERLTEEPPADTRSGPTSHPGIYKIEEPFHTWPVLTRLLKTLEEACRVMDHKLARKTLTDATAIVSVAGQQSVKPLLVDAGSGVKEVVQPMTSAIGTVVNQ